MDYQKTWEVMNSLEQSFNRVTTIGDLINDLSESLEREDLTDSRMILNALKAYYPAFLEQYDRTSKRAWNNTVVQLSKDLNEEAHQRTLEVTRQRRLEKSSNIEYPSMSYEEIERFFRDEDVSYTRDPDYYYNSDDPTGV